MTDTRKAIIELIEPYMIKDWVKWCLYIVKTELTWMETMYENDWSFALRKDKIVWHYDITSVLKYIWNHNWNFQQTYKDDFIWMTWRNLEMSISDIAIPNKPLHLYTEQEDKKLLQLLIKLK